MPKKKLIAKGRELVDAFNASDWDRFRALTTEDCVYNELGTQRQLQGQDEIVQVMEEWKQAFPDAAGTVTNAIASGNTVVLEISYQGTQTGPLETPSGTIPASGNVTVTPAIQVLEFEGKKVKANRQYFDSLTLLQQIGAVPAAQEQV